ncbi:hypothetical protein GCM10020001_045560 [Nonomuraea salmonea]
MPSGGDGTYVRATSELSGAMLRRLRQAEQLEILEVRRALEVESARLAATRRTDEDIRRIEAALAERERAWELDDPDFFVEADLAFHMAVAHATHNLVLIDLYEDFSAALRASITAAGTSLNKNYIPPRGHRQGHRGRRRRGGGAGRSRLHGAHPHRAHRVLSRSRGARGAWTGAGAPRRTPIWGC